MGVNRDCCRVYVQELAAEGGEAAELLLNSENLERVLWARLSLLPTGYPQTPLQYLLGSYARAGGELRAASALKDAALQARACEAMTYARGLVVSYTGLMLNMEMFPQVARAPPPLPPPFHPWSFCSHSSLWRWPVSP